jgi:hypothetical protein
MGDLKPFITGFVEIGMAALQTADMKATIIRAFEQDGLFNIIRSEGQQLIAEASMASRTVEESSLTLPFTWGQLRRNLEALADEQNEMMKKSLQMMTMVTLLAMTMMITNL